MATRDNKDCKLYTQICGDLKARDQWESKDERILKRRLGERAKQKNYPYKGAPNFVEPLIDDIVNSKTDQEISMFFNALHVCHVAPLGPMDNNLRAMVETGFDSYFRYVIPRSRAKLEEAMDTKNARGFSVLKQVRGYSHLLEKDIPDFEVIDLLDVIVPPDTTSISDAEYICHVMRLTEREFKRRAREKGWENWEDVLERCKSEDRDGGDRSGGLDTYGKTKGMVGLTESKDGEYVVVWEIYHYAVEKDEDESCGICSGKRMVTILCPDAQDLPLAKYPWKEADVLEAVLLPGSVEPEMVVVEEGHDRPWPFVQPRYENRSRRYYDSRGLGHLLYDDQIAATALKNAQFTMLEYYQKPMFSGNVQNSANVTLEPGSFLPEGCSRLDPPNLPGQLNFDRNDLRATASRRAGTDQYNYSTDFGSRKLQKTATEVKSDQYRTSLLSSAAVDRFNEPLAELCQLLWDDMKRIGLEFSIIIPGEPENEMNGQRFGEELYSTPIMLQPAASAKTLNPDMVLMRYMNMYQFNATYAQQTGFDFLKAARVVNSSWDPRLTAGWLPSDGEVKTYEQRLGNIEQAVGKMAVAGKQIDQRLTNTEELASKVAAKPKEAGNAVL
ncbi:MAG: hypothetical protein EOM20_03275 [Spartobacteria bacterium]|nr:hypothetical protein [Spartobacteria bacterium]